MNKLDLFKISIEALKKNRLRTILSVSGVVIGISTLVIILGISGAAKGLIQDQLNSFGTDTIFIEVKVPETDQFSSGASIASGVQIKTMTEKDVFAVRKNPNIKSSYGAMVGQEKIVYKNKNFRGLTFGTNAEFIDIDSSKVAEGRFFTPNENFSAVKVVVLGKTVKDELFGNQNALNKKVRVNNTNLKVIGVMKEKGAAFFQNYDEQVYLPLKTQENMLGRDYLVYFVAQVKDSNKIEETVKSVTTLLRREHKIKGNEAIKDDFQITSSEQALKDIGVAFQAVSILFGGIASISLIVGGVGIMNIMYVSVTERTREIGLRKAIGARRRDILLQFLLEALLITLFGGLSGILMGFALSSIISIIAGTLGFNLDMSLSGFGVFIGFLVTVLAGITFGFAPARKAAGLQPIEALRAE